MNSKWSTIPAVLAAVLFLCALPPRSPGEELKIEGSRIVSQVVNDVAQALRSDRGMDIEVVVKGGSSGGIEALGTGAAQIGMIARPLTAEDRGLFPRVNYKDIPIGAQVIAFAVSPDVWESGVKSLDRKQLRGIYEGRTKNWKEVGGADQEITFFTWPEGHGVWEMFAEWMYEDARRAPLSKATSVSTHEGARNSIEFTRGAIGAVSPLWVDGKSSYALALKLDDGTRVEPVLTSITTHAYPLTRWLYLVINDRPTGDVKVFIDFILSETNQALFRKHGFYTASQLGMAPPAPQ